MRRCAASAGRGAWVRFLSEAARVAWESLPEADRAPNMRKLRRAATRSKEVYIDRNLQDAFGDAVDAGTPPAAALRQARIALAAEWRDMRAPERELYQRVFAPFSRVWFRRLYKEAVAAGLQHDDAVGAANSGVAAEWRRELRGPDPRTAYETFVKERLAEERHAAVMAGKCPDAAVVAARRAVAAEWSSIGSE
eukprot:TRINITY_DN25847_c0_g1_i1.p2 TRINITY_DN25847_c0_g1~~TRINITY_DN25847_c0_g1_i1.p2  ORF type:complete len:194 (+),score=63.55 TRINITY_DN25847_c0_g1_i1:79-660(+)